MNINKFITDICSEYDKNIKYYKTKQEKLALALALCYKCYFHFNRDDSNLKIADNDFDYMIRCNLKFLEIIDRNARYTGDYAEYYAEGICSDVFKSIKCESI